MHNSALGKKLGYVFRQPQLLQRALTHRSYAPEHNERMEFLGDSILGCVIAKYLYSNYPQLSEGELSRLRSNLVREEHACDTRAAARSWQSFKAGRGRAQERWLSSPFDIGGCFGSPVRCNLAGFGFQRGRTGCIESVCTLPRKGRCADAGQGCQNPVAGIPARQAYSIARSTPSLPCKEKHMSNPSRWSARSRH